MKTEIPDITKQIILNMNLKFKRELYIITFIFSILPPIRKCPRKTRHYDHAKHFIDQAGAL